MLAADGCLRGPLISLIQDTSRAAMLHRFLEFVGSPDRPLRKIKQRQRFGCGRLLAEDGR